MPTLERIPEVLPPDLDAVVKQLQSERVELIDGVRETQLMARALYQEEAQRLADAAGADDARVGALRARIQYYADVAAALEVESQIAKIRTISVAASDAVVHGRLVDAALRALPDTTVSLVGDGGEDLGIPPVHTDAGGYYAFVVPREVAAKIGPQRELTVAVGEQRERFTPAAVDPVTLNPGTRVLQDVTLRPAEIDRIRGPLVFDRESAAATTTRATATSKPAKGAAPTARPTREAPAEPRSKRARPRRDKRRPRK